MASPQLRLARGRRGSLDRRHPWLFAGAVAAVDGSPAPGDTVDVVAADGTFLARAAYSPASQIVARAWTFDDEPVDAAFLRRRLERAVDGRREHLENEVGACRLVHSESDGLPGVTVDRYGPVLVVQLSSAGAERWRAEIVDGLRELVPAATIYERSDAEVRAKEGLEPRTGLLAGAEPAQLVEIVEADLRYLVDVRAGHKTGFYLDQRRNRRRVAERAAGREVLNCFAYTGAFGLAALAAGAGSVVQVESSAPALALAERHLGLNGLDPGQAEHVEGNVFSVLRGYRAEGRRFDLIVLDPPRFADSRARLKRAARGYKDINLLAFQLLRPGGLLATFSCSGLLAPELFQKIVADAALDARREAQILHRLGADDDHPTALAFPEGSYLKGLLCRAP